MSSADATRNLVIHSTVKRTGELEVALVETALPPPADDEVTVRMEATPLNPSDLGLLFAGADPTTLSAGGTADRPLVKGRVPEAALTSLAARLDRAMPVGNEGAGVVIRAGRAPEAQALLGRTVALFGGGMYAQLRTIKAVLCMVLPEGTEPADGASAFVNPLTVLGMIETMRREGHRALVHTAAASNVGQMLNRVCIQDGIPLVNVVRRREQEELLRAQGARYVVDSSAPTFLDDLRQAVGETGATLAFDAIGGGQLASQILATMEAVLVARATEYNRYGSATHKQVYIYGSLDRGPIELGRNFGLAWGIGGWLVSHFLEKIGPAAALKLRERVAAELTTTFASQYGERISLAEALRLEHIARYAKIGTAGKFLIVPSSRGATT